MGNNIPEEVDQIVAFALQEDLGRGDITSAAVYKEKQKVAGILKAKQSGVVAGLELGGFIYGKVDTRIQWHPECNDGFGVKKGDVLARVAGPALEILTAERTVLNFMQRMSGIATQTRRFVDAVSHTKTEILDTRKTAPGHRYLDKWAVRLGGGKNHRMRLDDLFLIKENHITVAGGVSEAIEACHKWRKEHNLNVEIEIEIREFEQVESVLETGGVDYILLDNMSLEEMRRIVDFIDGSVKLEASGNMTLERVASVAETGVDYISVGSLTHSVQSLDISFLLD